MNRTLLGFLLVASWWGVSEAAFAYNVSAGGNIAIREWDSRYLPNPLLYPSQCGVGHNKSLVCDPGKILQPIQVKQLNDLISSKTSAFRCVCKEKCTTFADKYVIMVAIVPRVKVTVGATLEEKKKAVDVFANELQQRHWAAGNCDNSIVIVLCTEYKRMHAVPGLRIGKFLSEECLASMVNESRDLISDKFYHKAVHDFVDALSLNIMREDCIQKERPYSTGGMSAPPWVVYVVGGIITVVFIILILFGIRRYRRYRQRNRRSRDPPASVVYRPASRELVEQYEAGAPANPGGYPFLHTSSHHGGIIRTPISKSHGSAHHPYEHVNTHDGYDTPVRGDN